MMTKNLIRISIFSCVVGIIVWALRPDFTQGGAGQSVPIPSLDETPSTAQEPEEQTDEQKEEGPVFPSIPSQEVLREEVAEDPHGLAPSIIEFATDMAPHFERALKSEENARVFLIQLEHCVESVQNAPMTIRAICLSNAKILADQYPSLAEKVKELMDTADPAIQRLM